MSCIQREIEKELIEMVKKHIEIRINVLKYDNKKIACYLDDLICDLRKDFGKELLEELRIIKYKFLLNR